MKKFSSKLIGILTVLAVLGCLSLLSANTPAKEKQIAKDTKKASVNIAGMGTVDTGVYSEIHISGSGSLKGTIITNTLGVSGQASSAGKITAETIDISGAFSTMDDLSSKKLNVAGSFSAGKNVNAETASFSGAASVARNLKSSKVSSAGTLSVAGDAQLGDLYMDGSIHITGKTTAKEIVIKLSGESTLASVHCVSIEVKESTSYKWLEWFSSARKNHLVADTIDAAMVHLEQTDAKLVRGNNIKIGKSCKIDLVEYTGTYEADSDAKVGKVVKK